MPISCLMLDDCLLVRPAYGGATESGVQLPDKTLADENNRVGVVVAVGPGRAATKDEIEMFGFTYAADGKTEENWPRTPDGIIRYPMNCKIGDVVYFHRAMECRPQGPGTELHYVVRDRDASMKVSGIPKVMLEKPRAAPVRPLAIANAAGQIQEFVKP